jgi:hypothetical protein
MACTDEALRLAARLIIYSGDENAMRPERSCSELDLIPPAEIESLNCSRSSGLWSFSHAFFGRI